MGLNIVTNPFGIPAEPLSGVQYASPVTAINSVLFDKVDSIFSYKSAVEADLFDSALKKWLSKPGSPYFMETQVRSGAGLIPLGFSNGKHGLASIIAPGYALSYFVPSFKRYHGAETSFAFNVGTFGYDDTTGEIVSDYIGPLKAASELGYPLVIPLCPQEIKNTTLLTLLLAKYGTDLGAIQLFDGPTYSRSILKLETGDNGDNTIESFDLDSGSSFEQILQRFNEVSGANIGSFEYVGDKTAETVFVVTGSVESALFTNTLKGVEASGLGVLTVRIPLPFDQRLFASMIPSSARNIIVIGQSLDNSPSWLKCTVATALFYQGVKNVKVSEYIYQPSFIWSPKAVEDIIRTFSASFMVPISEIVDKFIYWAPDCSKELDVSSRLVHSLSLVDGYDTTLRTKFDNISNAGLFQAQFSTFPTEVPQVISNIDVADIGVVSDISVLQSLDVTANIKDRGTILIVSKTSLKEKDLTQETTLAKDLKLPLSFINSVKKKDIKIVFIDAETIGDREETKGRTLSFVMQAVFWRYAYGLELGESVKRIWNSSGQYIELLAAVLSDMLADALAVGLFEVCGSSISISATGNEVEEPKSENGEGQENKLPIFLKESSFVPNPREVADHSETNVGSIINVSKGFVFKEAYGAEVALRPDLPVKSYIVKVKENRRLTPEDYDRNIFHIEFDITGTGLKYGIGEALGIHARNNEESVKEFLKYYGLCENDVIAAPNNSNPEILESISVLQLFRDRLDLLGKPPKKFYESLVEFATDETEKQKLQDLVTPAGAATLKNYQEVEYYTYVDILELFPSARPPLKDLVNMISPLKRREYSIASSQRVHENELHLLIVVVDWVDPRGRKRYGHASRYLSKLLVGTELVVSVKPSVMKLPPSPEQPVIMSGLGTGLAPFKAIVEEKLWQKQQGHDIGEVYLFLGSRHKREEYLYGELWEAYKDAGIITHIGAAFSRDQPQKIYIQDRIREVLDKLKTAMIDKRGSFYLCGPTWPVPDISHALQDIIAADAKEKGIQVDLDNAIEELKETSRYILEVY
ncbi:sulfite reductase subunit alpha Ecym_4391 [Eremothecium cymbalariae DBVPG|uniref:assimilatory sulfite reductase (NADPH) n=1 Tax=Eremothecium cymbalariae (strain CBS 270.75 / DBVPG 7215 / KCTC 17166 / NRRL Y-17582) TaxID=931890 RepID=G8JTU2_ERECY|nr:hypothetical protein Ecym_4391 [Eremothecium cymbalariae DBVPG\